MYLTIQKNKEYHKRKEHNVKLISKIANFEDSGIVSSAACCAVAIGQSFLIISLWQLLTSCRQLSDGFRCNWQIKMQRLWDAALSQLSLPLSSHILIGQLKWKSPEIVKKMSQTNKEHWLSGNVMKCSTVTVSFYSMEKRKNVVGVQALGSNK